ncbi:uncharacterized protein TNCV_858571 [Trichonephila clavipes]|nr:uncharacterized protein TNCV_858571 [Trichonephila clavipes]
MPCLSYISSLCSDLRRKILQDFSLIVTDFMSDEESMKVMNWYIVPTWTMTWFVVLTMCGTQVKANDTFIKDMNQEVARRNFVKKMEEQKYLNILNSCSDIELRFTGRGMFVVDKTLLLTTTRFLETYGVLFATKVSKIPY